MAALAYTYQGERRILLVHGYNVGEAAGQRSMAHLRHALREGCSTLARQLFTVTWPGNAAWHRGGPAAYFAIVPVARKAGEVFADYLVSEYELGGGPRELVIIAHSLGCRLTLEFLRNLDRKRRPARLEKIVVILMAAAVPCDMDDLLGAARANADEVVVLHSSEDKVLRRWFRLGETAAREGTLPEAIGYKGNPTEPPWSYERRMKGYDHGDYWTSPPTVEAVAERLEAYFPDIKFRKDLARENHMAARPSLDGTDYLSAYSLPCFPAAFER